MHKMSKTFFQSGPTKEQVSLHLPANFSNLHWFSHLSLRRLLPCSRLYKTSFNLHNLSRTSSSLPSLTKPSFNLHNLSKTSSSLSSLPKTSFSSNLLRRWDSFSSNKTNLRPAIINLAPKPSSLSLKCKHSLASRTYKHLDRLAPALTCLLNSPSRSNSVINTSRSLICLVARLPILCNGPNLHSFSSSSPYSRLGKIRFNPNSKSTVQIPSNFNKWASLGSSAQLVALRTTLTLNYSAGYKLTRLHNHNKIHMLIV